jgi:uncharacterized SAM-binding protein YcdF (DUF218 family)
MFPGCILIVQAMALLFWRLSPRLSRRMLILTVLVLSVCSVPNIVSHLADLIEKGGTEFKLTDQDLNKRADAIVVLAGAHVEDAQEYHQDAISPTEVLRLRFAVDIAKATHLPILITGGTPHPGGISEATLMAEALNRYFGIQARWIEDKSLTTAGNALFSHQILARERINRIFLVTNAMHLRRARESFEKAGFVVIGAAMGYATDLGSEGSLEGWVPSTEGWLVTSQLVHEIVGLAWYKLRGY